MIAFELCGFLALLKLRLTLLALLALLALPDPFLVLIKMPVSHITHQPHCVCHLGQSTSNNYSGDY